MTESVQDSGYFGPSRMRFTPFLRVEQQGSLMTVVVRGLEAVNVRLGISSVVVDPIGACVCGVNDVKQSNVGTAAAAAAEGAEESGGRWIDSPSFLVSGHVGQEYLSHSLFHPQVVMEARELWDYKYSWDKHLKNTTEVILLGVTGALAMDYFYFMELPSDINSEKLSEISADLEHSNVSERALCRIAVGESKVNITSGLQHRIQAVIHCLSLHDYLPYATPPLYTPPSDLRLPTEEEISSLESNTPIRTYLLTILNPSIVINYAQHPTLHMKTILSARRRKKNEKASGDLSMARILPVPSVILQLSRLTVEWTKPMYPKRLVSTACMLRPPSPTMLYNCHTHLNINAHNTSVLINYQKSSVCVIKKFSPSLYCKTLLLPLYWASPHQPRHEYFLQADNLSVVCSAPQSLLLWSLASSWYTPQPTPETLHRNSLVEDALATKRFALLSLRLQAMEAKVCNTPSLRGCVATLSAATLTLVKPPPQGDLLCLLMSGPEDKTSLEVLLPDSSNKNTSTLSDKLLKVALQFPKKDCDESVPSVLTIGVKKTAFLLDPQFLHWLKYAPRKIDSHVLNEMVVLKKISEVRGAAKACTRKKQSESESDATPKVESSTATLSEATKTESRGGGGGQAHSTLDAAPPHPPTHLPNPPKTWKEEFVSWYPILSRLLIHVDLDTTTVFLPSSSTLGVVSTSGLVNAVHRTYLTRSSERNALADTLVITLPHLILHNAAQRQSLLHNVHDVPVILPAEIWATERDKLPWSLSLVGFGVYSLHGSGQHVKLPVLKPVNTTATLAITTKTQVVYVLKPVNTTATLAITTKTQGPTLSQLGLVIHTDMSPLEFCGSRCQVEGHVTICENLLGLLTHFTPLYPASEASSTSSTPVPPSHPPGAPHGDGSSQPANTTTTTTTQQQQQQQQQPTKPYHHNSSDQNTLLVMEGEDVLMEEVVVVEKAGGERTSDNEPQQQQQQQQQNNNNSGPLVTAWVQWTVARVSASLYAKGSSDSSSGSSQKLRAEMEDLTTALDLHRVYSKVKVKVTSFSVLHYVRRNNTWVEGEHEGVVLTCGDQLTREVKVINPRSGALDPHPPHHHPHHHHPANVNKAAAAPPSSSSSPTTGPPPDQPPKTPSHGFLSLTLTTALCRNIHSSWNTLIKKHMSDDRSLPRDSSSDHYLSEVDIRVQPFDCVFFPASLHTFASVYEPWIHLQVPRQLISTGRVVSRRPLGISINNHTLPLVYLHTESIRVFLPAPHTTTNTTTYQRTDNDTTTTTTNNTYQHQRSDNDTTSTNNTNTHQRTDNDTTSTNTHQRTDNTSPSTTHHHQRTDNDTTTSTTTYHHQRTDNTTSPSTTFHSDNNTTSTTIRTDDNNTSTSHTTSSTTTTTTTPHTSSTSTTPHNITTSSTHSSTPHNTTTTPHTSSTSTLHNTTSSSTPHNTHTSSTHNTSSSTPHNTTTSSTSSTHTSSLHNFFVVEIDSVVVTPQVDNPLSRIMIRSDIFHTAERARILGIPGSQVEDRQYQIDLLGFSVSTGCWWELVCDKGGRPRSSSGERLRVMGENPALEWNNYDPTLDTRPPDIVLHPFIARFDSRIIAAPAIVHHQAATTDNTEWTTTTTTTPPQDTLVAGHSVELNATSDIDLHLSLPQVTLLTDILHDTTRLVSNMVSRGRRGRAGHTPRDPQDSGIDCDVSSVELVLVTGGKITASIFDRGVLEDGQKLSVKGWQRSKLEQRAKKREQELVVSEAVSTESEPSPKRLHTHTHAHGHTHGHTHTHAHGHTHGHAHARKPLTRDRDSDTHSEKEVEDGYEGSEEGSVCEGEGVPPRQPPRISPLLYLVVSQPHAFLSCQPLKQRLDLSCFNLIVRSVLRGFSVKATEFKQLPCAEDYTTSWLETKPGDPHPKTCIPPALLLISATDFIHKPARINIEVGRPVRFYLSESRCQQVVHVFSRLQTLLPHTDNTNTDTNTNNAAPPTPTTPTQGNKNGGQSCGSIPSQSPTTTPTTTTHVNKPQSSIGVGGVGDGVCPTEKLRQFLSHVDTISFVTSQIVMNGEIVKTHKAKSEVHTSVSGVKFCLATSRKRNNIAASTTSSSGVHDSRNNTNTSSSSYDSRGDVISEISATADILDLQIKTIYHSQKLQPFLKPWTVSGEVKLLWLQWSAEPYVEVKVDTETLALEVGPEHLFCLSDILNHVSPLMFETGGTTHGKPPPTSPRHHRDKPPHHDILYQDDLRAGIFQYVSLALEDPRPYQVVFDKMAGTMVWCYPEPRTLTRVDIFPVPFIAASDYSTITDTQDKDRVLCALQYFDNLRDTFVTYRQFHLSESKFCQLDLPSFYEKQHIAVSSMWRVCIDFSEEDSNSGDGRIVVSPGALAACMRVDSMFSIDLLPRTQAVVNVGQAQVTLFNHLALTGKKLPRELRFFTLDKLAPEEQPFLTLTLENCYLRGYVWTSAMHFQAAGSVKMDILSYTYLTNSCLLEPTYIEASLVHQEAEGPDKPSCIDSVMTVKPMYIHVNQSIIHTLNVALETWQQINTTTVQHPQQGPDLTQIKKSPVIFMTNYLICNDMSDAIRFGQVGTDESLLLGSRGLHLYCWRTHKLPPRLHACVEGGKWKWCDAFSLDVDGPQVHTIHYEGRHFHFLVSVEQQTPTQRLITFSGLLSVANCLSEHLELRVVENTSSCSSSSSKESSSPRHTMTTQALTSQSVAPSCVGDVHGIRVRLLAGANNTPNPNNNNNNTIWSGEIPIHERTNKETTGSGSSVLVKIPLRTKGESVVAWCRVVRQRVCSSGGSGGSSSGVWRVLVVLSPQFVVRSHLPRPLILHVNTPASDHTTSQVVVKGRGHTHTLPCDGSLPHHLTFQLNPEYPVSSPPIPLSRGMAEQMRLAHTPETVDISQCLRKLFEGPEERWPYAETNNFMGHVLFADQPKIDLQVGFSGLYPHCNTVVVDIRPWALLINHTGIEMVLEEANNTNNNTNNNNGSSGASPSPPSSGRCCWFVPSGAVFAPPKLDGTFTLGLMDGEQHYHTQPLQLSKEDRWYSLKFEGRIPRQGTTPLRINTQDKMCFVTIHSTFEENIHILHLLPTYSIANNTTEDLTVRSMYVYAGDIKIQLPVSVPSLNLPAKSSQGSVNEVPLLIWYVLKGPGASVTDEEVCCVQIGQDGYQGHPAVIRDNLPDRRMTITLPNTNANNINPNTNTLNRSFLLTHHRHRGQVKLVVQNDPSPQMVIHNNTPALLILGQSSSKEEGIMEEELDLFAAMPSVPPNQSVLYTFPHTADTFPHIPPSATQHTPRLHFSQPDVLNNAEVEEVLWSQGVDIQQQYDQFVSIPGHGDVKVRTERIAHTAHVFVDPVSRVEVSARDIRSRIAAEPSKGRVATSTNKGRSGKDKEGPQSEGEASTTSTITTTSINKERIVKDVKDKDGLQGEGLSSVSNKSVQLGKDKEDTQQEGELLLSASGCSNHGHQQLQHPVRERQGMMGGTDISSTISTTTIQPINLTKEHSSSSSSGGGGGSSGGSSGGGGSGFPVREIKTQVENKSPKMSPPPPPPPPPPPTVPKKQEDKSTRVIYCTFMCTRVILVLKDDVSDKENILEILRLSLDNFIVSVRPKIDLSEKLRALDYRVKEQMEVVLFIGDAQVDNQLYSRGQYDFPVILIRQDPDASPKLSPLDPLEQAMQRSHNSALFTLTVIVEAASPNLCLHSVHIKLKPITLYAEDVVFYSLMDILSTFLPTPIHQQDRYTSTLSRERGGDTNTTTTTTNINNDNNYENVAIIMRLPGDILVKSNAMTSPIHITNLTLEPISVLLSVHASAKLYVALDRSPLTFGKYQRFEILTTSYTLGHNLTMHYLSGALIRAGWVVGSLDLLGNPGGFARTVGTGVRDFVQLPYEGILQGPWAFIAGVTHGSLSLVKHLTAGTVVSVTNLASSVARNMERLSLDNDHNLT
ncbi:hypothetical protein Pcinc_042542 [Petrolisthes cinctipes]|uniref:Uncharacterized protein n=1 Tax=Petrolisthes cinctipes TaxID=88211 RepID=A0AAE1EFV8_PETCI|nr:hypothetical protein Pcinc_042542 [Petrolisthes cinctipes]